MNLINHVAEDAINICCSSNTDIIISTYLLDDMEFGIEIQDVREAIFFKQKIITIPTSTDIIEGIINLRGILIPIINMRARFGLKEKSAEHQENCFAIVKYKGNYIGLRFDNISQVIRCQKDTITYFEDNENDKKFCNKGAVLLDNGKKVVQILNIDQLFKNYNIPITKNQLFNDSNKFLEIRQEITFMLNNQEYALGMNDIQEIIKIPKIESQIDLAHYIKGAILLRENLIPVVDLKDYLFNSPVEITNQSRIIILATDPLCGIIVDSIKEVINYEIDKLLNINDFNKNFIGNTFENIIALSEKRNIIKINSKSLFTNEAKKQIKGCINVNKKYNESDLSNWYTTDDNVQSVNKTFIVFRLGENFAIDIDMFQEIIKYSDTLTVIPGSQKYFEGMLNLRGTPVPIINLRKFYGLQPAKTINESKILIVKPEGNLVGIIVDDIIEILKTDRVKITEYPRAIVNQMVDAMKDHIDEVFTIEKEVNNSKASQILMVFNVIKLIQAIDTPDQVKQIDENYNPDQL